MAPGIAAQFATVVDARDIGCPGCAEPGRARPDGQQSDMERLSQSPTTKPLTRQALLIARYACNPRAFSRSSGGSGFEG